MPIYELQFENLGPFDEIRFEFDPQINVFVGPNNSGKSTVLMALADLAVFDFCVPEKLLRKGEAPFVVQTETLHRKKRTQDGVFPIEYGGTFWDKKRARSWEQRRQEFGYACLIPALRWSTDYRAEKPISERANSRGKKYALPEFMSLVQKGWIEPDSSPSHASIAACTRS